MPKSLIYVPMFHMEHEKPDATRMRNKVSTETAFKYWSSVAPIAVALIKERNPTSFHVFCEDWSTKGQLKVAIANVENRIKTFQGAVSFVASMLALGGTPRITEDSMALKLADIAMQKQMRMIKNPKIEKVPLMHEEIIGRRDRAIASRMTTTVEDGGLAVLCMGAAHDIPAHLDGSWRTTIVTTPAFADEISAMSSLDGLIKWPEMYRQQ